MIKIKNLLPALALALLASPAYASSDLYVSTTGNVGIANTSPGALLDLGLSGTTTGAMRLEGGTSGYVQIQPAGAAGSWALTLPNSAGTNGYVLSTDGTGVTSWVANGGGGGSSSSAVGTMINDSMSVTSASATATFAADQIVVATSLGGSYETLSSYSESVDLATTGAGGMDTGSAPASGYVSLYAIYGTSGTSILACNVTISDGTIYSGANMPSGYTYSALIGIWPTNSSSKFPVGYERGREVFFPPINVLNSSTAATSYTSLSVSSAIPPGATFASGWVGSATTSGETAVAGDANGTGETVSISYNAAGQFRGIYQGTYFKIPVITSQTIYYENGSGGGQVNSYISVSGYVF